MEVEVKEVKTRQELKKFIQFPQKLYKEDPNYVSELQLSMEFMLTRKNPFLQHSQIALFLATINKEIVGRIAAIHNTIHLEVYNDNTGFFGLFEAIDSVEVAQVLFRSASDWLKEKGMTQIVGPTNLTTNDSCGFLFDGFEYRPMVMMPYNFKYYNELCEQCGFEKRMDLYSYEIKEKPVLEKYENVLKRCFQKMNDSGLKIRSLSMKHFNEDITKLRNVYNKCNINNWGFIPLNEKEFFSMANDLKRIAPTDCALVVEKDDEFIGFVVAVPDINQAFQHVANGKLLPFGFLKLLWYKQKINEARIMILGVLKEYSGQGIDLALYHKITEVLHSHNIYRAEASFVLENNTTMNSILQKIEGKRIKEYRIYGKKISFEAISSEIKQ
ncbi:hypothetical protein FEDK69T_18980 [Flavobacterium enshiense DK69]|uniref:GNAT family N-acetyltransferase n=1 Tax=Flavobacterium enshiense TaxID=1341165 RepID=UPI0003C5DB83|nr:GNAT family N-acetyltransferase [Flavobacterium enshiense]ESU22640.1 hypothetical protein FEDK69T_18980 [Flavobacterium enshiense DK69]